MGDTKHKHVSEHSHYKETVHRRYQPLDDDCGWCKPLPTTENSTLDNEFACGWCSGSIDKVVDDVPSQNMCLSGWKEAFGIGVIEP
jgi:hypothetical protein